MITKVSLAFQLPNFVLIALIIHLTFLKFLHHTLQ